MPSTSIEMIEASGKARVKRLKPWLPANLTSAAIRREYALRADLCSSTVVFIRGLSFSEGCDNFRAVDDRQPHAAARGTDAPHGSICREHRDLGNATLVLVSAISMINFSTRLPARFRSPMREP
jgi:hypothetical protein